MSDLMEWVCTDCLGDHLTSVECEDYEAVLWSLRNLGYNDWGAQRWMHRKRRMLNGRTPHDVMATDGPGGVAKVMRLVWGLRDGGAT